MSIIIILYCYVLQITIAYCVMCNITIVITIISHIVVINFYDKYQYFFLSIVLGKKIKT